MFLESTDMELFRNVRTNKDLDSYDGEVIDVEDCIDSVCMYLGLLDLPGGQRPLEARGVPGESGALMQAESRASLTEPRRTMHRGQGRRVQRRLNHSTRARQAAQDRRQKEQEHDVNPPFYGS